MPAAITAADPSGIARAARLLMAGELVAFPTETVYGLGADAANPEAVRRIFAAKGRPADHPLIVHVAAAADLAYWARDVPLGAARLAAQFWPGPLTLILPRSGHADDAVTGGQDSVGVRVPAHPVALALLHAFRAVGGHGIAAPSANRFGHVSPTTARHVADDLGDAVAMIVDGGPTRVGIESTIVAFTSPQPTLLRPGGLAVAAIEAVLGAPLALPDATAPRASGTLASHYAPHTAAQLVPAQNLLAEIDLLVDRDETVAVLARTVARPRDFDGAWIAAVDDAEGYARMLYASLRELDAARADAILIEDVPAHAEWLAVRDRLARATHG
ncbi:MAG: threonylcarbamoyl-AMP synthase [Proteobacteria bacterium]|nr:threonylcarbamoyl-AMP synthase [Pseudomonadota bacterium]